MEDVLIYKAKWKLVPAPGFRIVERDMIIVRDDGTLSILKAGTRLPYHIEELIIEVETKAR